MARIAEYKQTGTKTEQQIIHHPAIYDSVTNEIEIEEWDETIDVEVPVIGLVYRDMTQEQINDMEQQIASTPQQEPTEQERIKNLEQQNDDLVLLMAELIGGGGL